MNNLLYKLQQMIADLAKTNEAENLGNDTLDRAGSTCGVATAQASTIPGCECNTTSMKPTYCKDNTGKDIDCAKPANVDIYGCFPLADCALDNPPAGCKICDTTTNPNPPSDCPVMTTNPTTPTIATCPTDLIAAASIVGCECIAGADSSYDKCKDVDCSTTPTADGCSPVDCKTRPDYFGCEIPVIVIEPPVVQPLESSCSTGNCTIDSGCKFMYVDKDCQYGQFDLLAYIKSNSSTILNLDLTTANFTDIDLTINKTIIGLQKQITDLTAKLEDCCSVTNVGGCEYIAYDGVFVDIQPANIKVQRGEMDASGNCTIPEYEGPANDNNSIRFLLSPDLENGSYKIEQIANVGEI